MKHGAAPLPIGEFYPYMRGRDPHTPRLIRELKGMMNPERRMNPGALGL